MYSQANPMSLWSLGTHWAKLNSVCRWLHLIMWWDPDLLLSRSSLSLRLPAHSKAQIQPKFPHPPQSFFICLLLPHIALSALYFQGLYSQTYLVLPSNAKHCFLFTIQFLNFLALEQILLRTPICIVPGHGCVVRLSHNLSAAPPDSSQGHCCCHRSFYTSKGQLPATPYQQHLPSQGLYHPPGDSKSCCRASGHRHTKVVFQMLVHCTNNSACMEVCTTPINGWNIILQKILKKTL